MNYLDKKDIQSKLKLGNKQVSALMRADGFPSVRIGNKYLVEESALDEYLSNIKNVKLDYTGL